jgi:hypothetical protein
MSSRRHGALARFQRALTAPSPAPPGRSKVRKATFKAYKALNVAFLNSREVRQPWSPNWMPYWSIRAWYLSRAAVHSATTCAPSTS